ncbi:site-specific integrase [Nocardia sp. X0981]
MIDQDAVSAIGRHGMQLTDREVGGGTDDADEAVTSCRPNGLQSTVSKKTALVYRAPVQRFKAWCAARGYSSRPADPEVVAAFLAAADAEGEGAAYRFSASTLRVWAAAIRRDHLDAGLPDPSSTPVVRSVLVSMARRRTDAGRTPERVYPLVAADLCTLIDSISARAAEGDWKSRITACRDTALIVMGFYSARQRSEIAAIRLGDLIIATDDDDSGRQWIMMRIRGSNTSRTTADYARLPRSRDPRYCPWCRLLDWLVLVARYDRTIGSIKDRRETRNQQSWAARRTVIRVLDNIDHNPQYHHCGRELPAPPRATAPVWRPLAKSTQYLPVDTGQPITDQTIAYVLKKRCREAGFQPAQIARISGGSLRSGFITQAHAEGISSEDIKLQSGHRKTESVDRYYVREPRYRRNAVDRLPL